MVDHAPISIHCMQYIATRSLSRYCKIIIRRSVCIKYDRLKKAKSRRSILFDVKLYVSVCIVRISNKASHNDLFSFRKRRCLQKKPTKGIIISVMALAEIPRILVNPMCPLHRVRTCILNGKDIYKTPNM